jgi:hypothetical protein
MPNDGIRAGELTVLKSNVLLDGEHLPHEFTAGTDSLDPFECQVGDVDEFLKQTDKGIEMMPPYLENDKIATRGHNLKPAKKIYRDPVVPLDYFDKIIRSKVEDIALEANNLKKKVTSILLTDDPVNLIITRFDVTLNIPTNHPNFFNILSYWLYGSAYETNAHALVSFSKAGVVLKNQTRHSLAEISSLFNLDGTIQSLRKKIAIHRQISARINSVDEHADRIRLKGSNAHSILKELDEIQHGLGGFAQIYNTDIYTEIESIHKETQSFLHVDTRKI